MSALGMDSKVLGALFIVVAMTLFGACAGATQPAKPPRVTILEDGARITAVKIETYGIAEPAIVRRYLSLHEGDRLRQSAVDQDFTNLTKLAGAIPRLTIRQDPSTHDVTLDWIVMSKQFDVTTHPVYAQQPLAFPIEGVGFDAGTKPLDRRGSTLSMYTQFALRADLAEILYTMPVAVDATTGREQDVLFEMLAARGTVRASQPVAQDIHSYFTGVGVSYLIHGTDGTQFEIGVRERHATSNVPTYINAPSVYDTYYNAAKVSLLEAGLSHACTGPPTQWYPPFCSYQYKVEFFDGIGGLGATSEYQTYVADLAHYTRVGNSTLALHGMVLQTGGVLPTSSLVCGVGIRGYPKPFCGTDARVLQAEYRINDALPGPFKLIAFAEEAAARVRGGEQAFAPPAFQWHADAGIGVMYHGVRLNLAHGSEGNRLTYELQGQLF
jgi:hypothetical protein